MWTAISCAIYAGVFVPLMTDTMSTNPKTSNWSDQTKQKNCLLALVGLGLGEILGSLLLGQIQDRYSNRITILTCLLLSSLAIGVTILFVRIFYFQLWFAILMCFAWGFQDGGMNCYISCLLGFQFESKTTPFSVFKTVQSLSVFITLLVEAHVVT